MGDFETKKRIQMDMVKRDLLPEYKHLFNRCWGDIWDNLGKYNKLWLKEVIAARKCGKRSRDIETSWGNYLDSNKG